MADEACCLANGHTPKGPGSVCLGDSNGDGKDDACVAPPPVGCCWRCVDGEVECNNNVTQAACPSGWNWVQNRACGSSYCGEGQCEEEVVPAVSGWGLAVLAFVLLTGMAFKFGRRRATTTQISGHRSKR